MSAPTTPAAGHWLLAPNSLLLISGTLIGLNFPLGKLAADAGVSPLIWAGLISCGVILMLLPVQLASRGLALPSAQVLRYTMVSATISFVAPNLLLFTVIPQVGAGYTGLMFALSPVFTLLLATMLGMRTPGRLGLVGIMIGLLGATLVSLSRGAELEGPGLNWLLAAAGIPVALAAGNVYRSRYWPVGTPPNTLAFWGHLFAGSLFLLMVLVSRGSLPIEELRPVGGIVVVQMLISGLNFPFFYRLQRDGGPVLLSQIGYVAAAVSLLAATVFLGERYSLMTWLGGGVIAMGILATVLAQSRDQTSAARAERAR